jgi:hypothetical protein
MKIVSKQEKENLVHLFKINIYCISSLLQGSALNAVADIGPRGPLLENYWNYYSNELK